MKGWRYESACHSLAARGIGTKFMKFDEMEYRLNRKNERGIFFQNPEHAKEFLKLKRIFCPKCNNELSRTILDTEGRYFKCPYCNTHKEIYDLIVEVGWPKEMIYYNPILSLEDIDVKRKFIKYKEWIKNPIVMLNPRSETIREYAYCPTCYESTEIDKTRELEKPIKCKTCHKSHQMDDYYVEVN